MTNSPSSKSRQFHRLTEDDGYLLERHPGAQRMPQSGKHGRDHTPRIAGIEAAFVPDRTTHDFYINNVQAYAVGCTVRQDHGLVYLTVHPTPLPE